ncbi:hypothetical protein ASD99_26980 [Mesorhizobium sp. Root695]|nr:hypothetical protein ASD99_26980 [Mesorhizobium sp. Root695]
MLVAFMVLVFGCRRFGIVADLFSSPTKALSSDAREHNDCRAVFGIQGFMPRFFMVEDLA